MPSHRARIGPEPHKHRRGSDVFRSTAWGRGPGARAQVGGPGRSLDGRARAAPRSAAVRHWSSSPSSLPILLLLLLSALDLGRIFYSRITVDERRPCRGLPGGRRSDDVHRGRLRHREHQHHPIMCAATRESNGSFVTVAPSDVALSCNPACTRAFGTPGHRHGDAATSRSSRRSSGRSSAART